MAKGRFPPFPQYDDTAEYQHYMDSAMKPEDTFRFSCNMCGDCCRCRSEPIIVSGFDIFRLAKGLNISPMEVIVKYMRFKASDRSRIPLLLLQERLDGSCRFLRKGACTVQGFKPIVCAVFPLGRFINSLKGEVCYFPQYVSVKCGGQDGKIWTLQEWIDSWGLDQWDQESLAWSHLLVTAENCMSQRKISDKMDEQDLLFLLDALYTEYDTAKPYAEQANAHREEIKNFFWENFHIKSRI